VSSDLWIGALLSIPIGLGTGLAGPPLLRWYKHRAKARRQRKLENQKAEYMRTLFLFRNPELYTHFLIDCAIKMILGAVTVGTGLGFAVIAVAVMGRNELPIHGPLATVLKLYQVTSIFLCFLGNGLLGVAYAIYRGASFRVKQFPLYLKTLPLEIRDVDLEGTIREKLREQLW
jgi:hypothetical protein